MVAVLRPAWAFDSGLGERKLLEQLQTASLAAWDAQDLTDAHAAAAALLEYAEHTQGRALTHVKSLQVARNDELIDLPLDHAPQPRTHPNAARRNQPHPALPARRLPHRHGQPPAAHLAAGAPRDRARAARTRLAAIGPLRQGLGQRLRQSLKGASDVERITARTALRQVQPARTGGPGPDPGARRPSCRQSARTRQLSGRSDAGTAAPAWRSDLLPPEGCAKPCCAAPCKPSPLHWCATAASSPTASTPSSTSCAPSRTTATLS